MFGAATGPNLEDSTSSTTTVNPMLATSRLRNCNPRWIPWATASDRTKLPKTVEVICASFGPGDPVLLVIIRNSQRCLLNFGTVLAHVHALHFQGAIGPRSDRRRR